jgi:hypothetical protein
MVSYKKSAANWDSVESKTIQLRAVEKEDFNTYLRQCINLFLTQYEEHVVVKELLRRKDSSLCATALQLFGRLGLLIRGWHEEGCGQAPEVLANQMDSILEFQIATTEQKLLGLLQDKLIPERDYMVNSLVILAILVLIERDLWRLMHWALYDCTVSPFIRSHCS